MTFAFPRLTHPLGLATTAQLREAGATDRVLDRLGLRGHRVLRGVYAPQPGPFGPEVRLAAAALWAGRDAVLTGATALQWHGLELPRPMALRRFLVPVSRRSKRRASGVVTHRTRRLPRSVLRNGIPIAPVERSLVDALRYRELTDRELRGLTLVVLQRRMTTADRLAAELEATRGPGRSGILDAVWAFRNGAWSPPEAQLAEGVRSRRDLPVMRSNPRLETTDGEPVGTPDGWFRDEGVVVQVHSRTYHDGLDAEGNDCWAATVESDHIYQRHDLVVVTVTPEMLAHARDTFLDTLATILRNRAGLAPSGIREAR